MGITMGLKSTAEVINLNIGETESIQSMPADVDQQLVERVEQGDKRAFDLLVLK